MTVPEPEEIKQILDVSQEFLAEAEDNLERRNLRSAVAASYYAVFHASKAALAVKGVETKSHKGLIQQFGQHFIRTSEIAAEHGRTLTDWHDDRQAADYLILTGSLEFDDVRDDVEKAGAFLMAIKQAIE